MGGFRERKRKERNVIIYICPEEQSGRFLGEKEMLYNGWGLGGRHEEHGELNLSSQRLRTFPSWKQTALHPQLPREGLLSRPKQMIRSSIYPPTGSSGVSRLLGEGQGRPGPKKLALLACKEACCISRILCAMRGSVHT